VLCTQAQLAQGAQLVQTADGQTFLYHPMGIGVDGQGAAAQQGSLINLNGSIIPIGNSGNQIAGLGARAGTNTITIPQNLNIGGNNIVRKLIFSC